MYIGFDIGGTNTRVAVSQDGRSIEAMKKFPTSQSAEEGMAQMVRELRELLGGKKATAAAGGIRGPIDRERGAIMSDTMLAKWVGVPVRQTLEKLLEIPVYLENDTALAGLGEAHMGAGRGYDIVAYHTVSTGVGGARIVAGKIDASSIGFEPGKQIVDMDYTKLGSDTDTLEELISGAAFEHRRGVKPYEIPQSDAEWEDLARYLAVGLKNTVAYWSPDVIVLGGSMMVGDPKIPLQSVRLHMNALLKGLMPCPPVFAAAFRDEGGLYGAFTLLRQNEKTS